MEYSLSFIIYFSLIFLIIFFSSKRKITSNEFVLGNRSLNSWVTALAAHASDMSNWLFMGYPAVIYSQGLFNVWIAIGLIFCMFFNWHYLAPKLRAITEDLNCLTLSSFFEKRLNDNSGLIHIFSAIICFIFYSIYIAAGLVGFGMLLENLLNIPYIYGILIGITIVISYIFIGGYITLAWIDFFQGLFLLFIILLVPIYIFMKTIPLENVFQFVTIKKISLKLIPDFSIKNYYANYINVSRLGTRIFWPTSYFNQIYGN